MTVPKSPFDDSRHAGSPDVSVTGSCGVGGHDQYEGPIRHSIAGRGRCGYVECDHARSIRPLYPFEPPFTDGKIRAAALPFARKIAGFMKPLGANETASCVAAAEAADTARRLLEGISTAAPARSRDE
ncbi:MAG: DUF2277 domain-containing protein [Bryobacterales bacterium]|nr:DUF2277 domain-containing protein [Bryobacterales bacterium]